VVEKRYEQPSDRSVTAEDAAVYNSFPSHRIDDRPIVGNDCDLPLERSPESTILGFALMGGSSSTSIQGLCVGQSASSVGHGDRRPRRKKSADQGLCCVRPRVGLTTVSLEIELFSPTV
jgi:hypothetical protein